MNRRRHQQSNDEATPICRCRVLYLGSSVPHVTKDGLQGIQEPLKELYPEEGATGAKGIDSWLSVWSNGLLLENVDENHKQITRFFPIDSLHYCAAVRHVVVQAGSGNAGEKLPRFLPLDSPFARNPSIAHPPLFACILRRTSGIKVLECHTFICKREVAANALVRCCFHAYADSTYAKQLENGTSPIYMNGSARVNGSVNGDPINGIAKVEEWKVNGHSTQGTTTATTHIIENGIHNGDIPGPSSTPDIDQIDGITPDDISVYNGLVNNNHKVWTAGYGHSQSNGDTVYMEYGEGGTLRSIRSNTTTTGRSNRPRQILMPVAPPPPPLVEEEQDKTIKKMKKKEQKKLIRKGSSVAREQAEMIALHHQMTNGGGSLLRPTSVMGMRSNSAMALHHPHPMMRPTPNGTLIKPNGTLIKPNGTLIRPSNGYGPAIYAVPIRSAPPRHPVTYRTMRPYGPPPPPQIMVHQPPRHMMVPPVSPHWNPYSKGNEEPIYFPNTPIMNNFVPSHPSTPVPEAYVASTATIERKMRKKKKSKDEDSQSHTGYNSETSPFNSGIYRKKGHLNERAFSYSIRQEHRSRSYGSLANLKFSDSPPAANGTNGTGPWKEVAKKEREIIQMVKDLELSGDDIERSEVHPSDYDSRMRRVSSASSGRR